jgi:hypothetical protein
MSELLPDWGPLAYILYFFGAVGFSAVIFIVFRVNRATKGKRTSFKDSEFFAENDEYVARKAIPTELVFTPDISGLPVKNYNDSELDPVTRKIVSQRQGEALKRAAAKMVRFDVPMTNNEIKNEFGYANLEVIAGYESNFERYTQAMLRWAQALYDEGEREDAEAVLEAVVNNGAQVSKCYTLLADIYRMKNDGAKLRGLYSILESKELPAKDKALKYIEHMLRGGS